MGEKERLTMSCRTITQVQGGNREVLNDRSVNVWKDGINNLLFF